ncbi:MAG: diguanylate cyclase/phosphodiesterase with sensor [Gammaproteobacteria bacterium]|nr:diguanylate cyclase/phosphodiesterase with sensor [Gammaproteobacteria bacterium]
MPKQHFRDLPYYAVLAGLPNRQRLEQRLQQAVDEAAAAAEPLAVISVGLDRFNDINDSLGLRVGDGVLVHVATLLAQALGDRDIAARTGTEQYAIILPRTNDAGAAAQAAKILAAVSEPLEVEGRQLRLRASLGVAMFPGDGRNAPLLLGNADAALHDAKSRGSRGCHFFTSQITQSALERLTLEADLRRAIGRRELEVHYQPQICMRTGMLSRAEALVRWRSPTRGALSPADFIPIAEESGLIVELGEWVLDEACRQAVAWRDHDGLAIPLAVNVSPTQLCVERPVDMIQDCLARHRIPPELLEIELTESASLGDMRAASALTELARLGVKLAVDDFGTGYSNLNLLGRLPLSTVKIDQSFVSDIENAKDAAIVHAIIGLAHTLGMRVVAEGVETRRQASVLIMARCDDFQGYLIAKPLEPTAFVAWAKETGCARPSRGGGAPA